MSGRDAVPLSETASPYARSLIAGGVAGTTVDLSLFPIDTLKTRLQSSQGFAASGAFRGIYAGVGSALVGSAPGAALFFVFYEGSKRLLRESRETRQGLAQGGPSGQLLALTAHGGVGGGGGAGGGDGAAHGGGWWVEPAEHMAAASVGEVAACAVRVPTEVVKQRAQAAQQPSSWLVLREILARRRVYGLRGVWRELYRGWSITVMREVPFTIIQFPLWEALKGWQARRKLRATATGMESAAFGCVSGAVAAGITTPLDVLKTRMMLAREKVGLLELAGQILRQSGARAFFAGLGPRIAWISAGGAIFLGSYQWASNQLSTVL